MALQQKFSPAVDDLVNEGAYKVLAIATALEATGRKVVHLEIGQPDYPTPQHIVDAGVGALHAGQTTYTNPSGTLELREAIAARVAETRAVPVAADQVVVGPGAKPGLFFCTMALLSPGDEAVVPDPGFPTYANMVRACGGVTVPVPLTMGAGSTGSMYDMAALEAAVSAKTRLLVVCSPSNPTGGVISEADLARLAALAAKWPRLYVLSDEIYSELVYDLETAKDAADAPAAERPCAPSLLAAAHRMGGAEGAALVERIILLDGFSKTYCMTGWRLGFAVMAAPLAARVHLLMTHAIGCTAMFTQAAGVAALADAGGASTAALADMRAEYRLRRDFVVGALSAMEGVSCLTPQGAFYAFPDVSALLGEGSCVRSSAELATRLLNEGGVALLPGTDFGASGEGFLRISYVRDMATLEDGMARVAKVLAAVREENSKL